jgi:hypothetical protein
MAIGIGSILPSVISMVVIAKILGVAKNIAKQIKC